MATRRADGPMIEVWDLRKSYGGLCAAAFLGERPEIASFV